MALVLPLAGCSLPGLLWPFGEETETPDPLPAPDQMPADSEPAMAAPVPPVTEVPQVRRVPPAGMTPGTVSKTVPSPDTDMETAQPRLQQPQSRVIAPPIPEQAIPEQAIPEQVIPEQADYHVQLASYRRKAEAERGWRRLQTDYPAVLGAHHPHIRRAELPEQGVFYRLSVRGFEDIGQSVSLCDALISAGGDCIVKEPG